MSFFNHLWQKNGIKLVVITLGVLLFFRYILPFLLPFFIAFFIVFICNPLLQKLHQKIRLPQGITMGILLALMVCLVLVGTWFLFCGIMEMFGDIRQKGEYLQKCCIGTLDTCCRFIGERLDMNPQAVSRYFTMGGERLFQSLEEDLAPKALDASYSHAGDIFEIIFCVVVTFIAIILLTKDYGSIKEKLMLNPLYGGIRRVSGKILTLLKVYLKAQCIIVLCVSLVATTGLFLCGKEYWFFFGVLTGFLDMLPFVGSGIVLLPIAIFLFLEGKIWSGAGCLLVYAICAFLRQFLEPKLIGDKLNIYPIFILLSIFFGLHFFHIGGIILGPASLFLIKEIYEEVKEDSPVKDE